MGSREHDAQEKSAEDYLVDKSEVTISELIGQGSTAVVYKGKLRGETIAVKEIMGLHEESLTAFQRELCVLVKVQHAHIVRFIGLVSESDPLRLCLEYCQGGSLFDLLYNQCTRLSWRQRVVMLYDTATAVAHLHSFTPKVVHRDLKSLNVLLLSTIKDEYDEPHVKLCDFGFAREREASMTQGAGTSHWMAPEVVSGTEYTEKADTFSFAMIMYEVVCSRVPFIEQDPSKVPSLIMSGVRPGQRDMLPEGKSEMFSEKGELVEVPPGLMDLIHRCWHQDPSVRPTFVTIWQTLAEVSQNTPDHLKLEMPGQLFEKPPDH